MRAVPAIIAALVGLVLGGCAGGSGSSASPPTETRFQAALETIGGGGGPVGTGYGWVDVDALRDWPGGLRRNLDWAAGALGPGADNIARGSDPIARAGVDARKADDMVSTAGSYAFGVRIDGVPHENVRTEYARAGATERRARGWTTFDLGAEKTVALGTPMEAFAALGSRTAAAAEGVALARSDDGRADVIGVGEPVAGSPAIAAASDCLGDVDAARLLPNNFTHLPNIGPDLIATGVRLDDHGTTHEVLCLVDPSEGEIATAAAALRKAFTGSARDALSGHLMSRSVDAADVDEGAIGDLHLARADLTLTGGTRPGLLFNALLTGSLVTYEGLEPPVPPGSGLRGSGESPG